MTGLPVRRRACAWPLRIALALAGGCSAAPPVGTDAGDDLGFDAPDQVADVPAIDTGVDAYRIDRPLPEDVPATCPEGPAPLALGVEFAADGVTHGAALPRCVTAAHVGVVPRGSTWTIQVMGLPPEARIAVYGAAYLSAARPEDRPTALASAGPGNGVPLLELQFTAARGGEHVLVIQRDDLLATDRYTVRAACVAGCNRVTSRFPLVLVHGYAGVDRYFGVVDYFWDIPGTLRAMGYEVSTPATDAIATTDRRAHQLATQVDAILRDTGARKVNFLAHSQGGLDCRFLISTMGYAARVASLTTIATPHHGIPLRLESYLSAQDFGPDYMERTFNPANPDAPGVRYWSWSARTCSLVELACQREEHGEIVITLLEATHALLNRYGDNDGIVTTSSMIWGTHLGHLSADHFDEVGQLFAPERDREPFQHRAFYRDEAARLAAAGL